jgi:hypothetical protein
VATRSDLRECLHRRSSVSDIENLLRRTGSSVKLQS